MKTIDEAIREHEFFRGIDPSHLGTLAYGATETEFNAGDVIFKEGDPASRFFLIQTGKIALEAHNPGVGNVRIQTLGPGDVLGWSWLFPPFAWHFNARAIEPGTALVLDGAHLLVTAEQNREFGYDLMKRVAQLLIRRLQAARRQLLDRDLEAALESP